MSAALSVEKARTKSFPNSLETAESTGTGAVLVNTHEDPKLEVDPLSELTVSSEDHVHYQTLNWWQCGVLMIAECISLGILSLPRALAVLGLIPGLILIVVLGIIAGYTGYIIGQFKLKHPSCTSMAEAGVISSGRVLGELIGLGQLFVLIFIMAAHITSFAVMMNVLTKHATCTLVFSLTGLAVSVLLTLPRTLRNISYFSIASCVSIFAAVFIVIVGVGVTKPDPNRMQLVGKTNFVHGMCATLNIILAYAGHVTYFGFASELKNPKDYNKSLVMLQSTAVIVYTVCAVIIYYFCGPYVPAPALSAASPEVRIAAYAVACPTIVIAGVVNGSVGAKQIYLRFWQLRKQPQVIQEKSKRAYFSWFVTVISIWVVAWLIASSIPKFEYVLALVAALFSGWYSFGLTSWFWRSLNKGKLLASGRNILLSVLNTIIFIMGTLICVLGIYACSVAMRNGDTGRPFSCANNDPLAGK
ncbi:uncharacterized protein PV09_03877 [Verruconis gallopava]|uniref:Amino acid transporter transmembrane domain-containing protein n=1 Tax=Verruconis gallopava TaxID=253628 RepID=A0A0D1XRP5_9PEZI|nr:uncharacterized protein PV09_03877 [Verruconis gallopava]KIW05361.1 hypothetical protein PV09_03877 [Verruconis gallopava]